MGEEILEDIALHVRAELAEVARVELVDHLLERVRIDDLQHRIAKVIGDLRLVLHERGHVGEDLVTDEVAQGVAALESPLGPAEAIGLLGKQTRPVAGAEAVGAGRSRTATSSPIACRSPSASGVKTRLRNAG